MPGSWINVTPTAVTLTTDLPCGNFGTLTVQVNASHPETVYAQFNCQGVWKSTDYGLNWALASTGQNASKVTDCAGGVATSPNSADQTVYLSCIRGSGTGFWASTDGGTNWTRYTVGPTPSRQDYYPPAVDPYDTSHLIMAGHEQNSYVQSTDGGKTWTAITTDAGMTEMGGTAGFVFIDTGSASTTRSTWLYSAQTAGGHIGTWRTANGGSSWTQVDKNEKEHSYWQIYQPNLTGTVFMAGDYSANGYGVQRSTDYGQTWMHVGLTQNENIVFGTHKHVYAMDGCCSGMLNLEVADQPGTGTWTKAPTPAGMVAQGLGSAQATVTNDGKYDIILAANWKAGLWRYIEP
jgi:hypothetical protein